ncbi:ChaN family lipoprotein [Pacificoceanicola onchidii]|uniref:ChaN family lipoprotein n=1 Tax=Pacificoceanicola onchidii TaxID=2562685 RepID=UPI0010A4E561|nr:ChaN family lipoprotein [Pacificoceanicola onchidii]
MRLFLALALLSSPVFANSGADIVILGEVHDNRNAHIGQAAALEALGPSAVVFEMLTQEEAAKADADRSQIEAAWEASGWSRFELYKPIFDALGDARIIGAAAPREAVRSVFSDGAAALFGPDAADFGLDEALPEEQHAARVELQFNAHCEAMPREMMGGMIAVQRYRDAVFARAALEALEAYGPPVAVITGNGHARTDWGIPAMIAHAAPNVTTHAIAFAESDGGVPFDEIKIVPPAEREDPCKAFK